MEIAQEGKERVSMLALGMAGTGKTTFISKFSSYLSSLHCAPYIVNLDPAVFELPYLCHIDIRDTIKYKKVMQSYNLGPNGAIMTCLNLFTTKFNQVLDILATKSERYVLLDTPGQIEVFTWSASGSIISQALATTSPTVILYILDVSKCLSPITFMSNMLYACSILYKSNLPLILVLNKIDIIASDFIVDWMQNFESFQEALQNEKSYSANLASSLSLVLDEFYEVMTPVSVSSVTGEGFPALLEAIDTAVQNYNAIYLPMHQRVKEQSCGERAIFNSILDVKQHNKEYVQEAKETSPITNVIYHRPYSPVLCETDDAASTMEFHASRKQEEELSERMQDLQFEASMKSKKPF